MCLVVDILTDSVHEWLEEPEGEKRLWQFTEKHLQGSSDNMNVLPLTVVQV